MNEIKKLDNNGGSLATTCELSIIVAFADNYAIGKDNNLLWHLSGDLKRFKSITMGHTIVMGRKTFESLPNGALPGRENVVLTNDRTFEANGAVVLHSIDELLNYTCGKGEVFIIGGGSIYEQLWGLAHKLYLTRVHKEFEADVFLSPIDFSKWELVEKEDIQGNGLGYSYENYILKTK